MCKLNLWKRNLDLEMQLKMSVGFCVYVFVFNLHNVANYVICIFYHLLVGWPGASNYKLTTFLDYVNDNNICFIFFTRYNTKQRLLMLLIKIIATGLFCQPVECDLLIKYIFLTSKEIFEWGANQRCPWLASNETLK